MNILIHCNHNLTINTKKLNSQVCQQIMQKCINFFSNDISDINQKIIIMEVSNTYFYCYITHRQRKEKLCMCCVPKLKIILYILCYKRIVKLKTVHNI